MKRKENEVDGVFDPTHKFFSLPNWEEKSKENVHEKKSAKLPQSFHNSTFNNNGIRVADFYLSSFPSLLPIGQISHLSLFAEIISNIPFMKGSLKMHILLKN